MRPWEGYKHHLEYVSPNLKVMMLSDLNVTISSSSKESRVWDYLIGYNSDRYETNGNGKRILRYCENRKLRIMNSMFRTKSP